MNKFGTRLRHLGLFSVCFGGLELELELIQTQMTQKPMLRAEVGMRVRCANRASAECTMRGRGIGQNSRNPFC